MFNLDNVTSKNDDKKWPHRMLIIGPSRSGKTNALLNLIKKDNDNLMDKIYLYAKDFDEPKYQFLTKNAGIKNLSDPSAFIEYANTMDDVYNNIDYCNRRRDDMIDDMIADIFCFYHTVLF